MKGLADTHRRALRDLSLDQYGYITPTDAEALGVPAIELRKIAQRGGLDHVAYGLYRFADIPITEFDTFMDAVLRIGPDAHLTHDAVLALHGLALVNPRRIRVGSPHRVRRTLPDSIEVIREQRPDLVRRNPVDDGSTSAPRLPRHRHDRPTRRSNRGGRPARSGSTSPTDCASRRNHVKPMTEPHTAPTNLRSLTTRLDNLARQSARPIRPMRTDNQKRAPCTLLVLCTYARDQASAC